MIVIDINKSENESSNVSITITVHVVVESSPIGTVYKGKNSYLNFGLMFSGPENFPVPECLVCREKLNNESIAQVN